MASSSNKKLLILYVLQVLKDYSDEDHPMLQEEISKKILSLYGMESERKAIGANIACLEDFGYDIIHIKNKGVYLGERAFEASEIAFLIDAIFSSKVINQKNSKELSKKLYSFLSINKRRQFNYIYKADDIAKSDNNQLFLTIEIINEAIENKRQIAFDYCGISYAPSAPAKKRVVSPFFMFSSQGKYYLVCSNGLENGLANYKVDRISNITITNDCALKLRDFPEYKNGFDKAKYVNEHIYAFSGKSVNATIKLYGEFMINNVKEWFDNARIYEKEGELFADVRSNEKALIYWCLQYGYYVELITPTESRLEIKKIIEEMKNRYND